MEESKENTGCSLCYCQKLVQRPTVGGGTSDSCWCSHLPSDHTLKPNTQSVEHKDPPNNKECILENATIMTGIREDIAWYPIVPSSHTSYSWSRIHTEHTGPVQYLAPFPGQSKEEIKEKDKNKTEKKTKIPEKQPKKKKEEKQDFATLEPEQVISRIEIKVGKFIEVNKHPTADRLYVSKVDVNEAKYRQVVSGLVDFITAEQLQGSKAIFITNLKPVKLKEVNSEGMVLCASTTDSIDRRVELVVPGASTTIGERIVLENDNFDNLSKPVDNEINIKKDKNIFSKVAPFLTVAESGFAVFKDAPLVSYVSKEKCSVATIRGGKLS